jgi:aldehyde dehydrogenase (NAD+)
MKQIEKVIKKLNENIQNNKLRSVKERKKILKRLYHVILEHEQELYIALNEDFKKPVFETYATEIGIILEDIRNTLRNIKRWTKHKKVRTPLHQFPASSFIHYEPYGLVLILAPWNYPFQLVMAPLIGAVAAGNTILLKPSEFTLHTARVIEKIINEVFDPSHVAVITGGIEETSYILKQRFDYIFFTGSTNVGKIVMKAAAENLTPVTLELGGKSPVYVDESVNVKLAARRIVWGKLLNAGQTCIAPDYCLVHQSRRNELIEAIIKELIYFYGMDVSKSPYYARIINKKHYQRLKGYLKGVTILHGGKTIDKDLYIEPTLVDNPDNSAVIMKEEIFGPILPLISVESVEEAVDFINKREKPLSLYIFSESSKIIKKVLLETSSGGVTVNDSLVHITNSELPFGGVGSSGMGSYHGYNSFLTFSHEKSVMKRATWLDLPFKYPPYKVGKFKIIKQLLK